MASGDHQIFLPGQLLGHPQLPIPEKGLPFRGEDLWDGPAQGRLNALVGVRKAHTQPLGQHAAHGGFSAAHHTDQNHVFHGRYPLKLPSTRNWEDSCPSSWSTPSMPGAARSPENSRKNRYSQPRPGMGRDSSFSRLSP